MTLEELQRELDTRDKGVLMHGSHAEGAGEFCALEFARAVKGLPWGDTPDQFPDIRPLNDGSWSSNEARTEAIMPVLLALWDWQVWDREKRQQWTERVVVATVQRIVSELPGLSPGIRAVCRDAATLAAAEAAAWAARAEARAAADAATLAARAAARAAARDGVLETACAIWIEAAQ